MRSLSRKTAELELKSVVIRFGLAREHQLQSLCEMMRASKRSCEIKGAQKSLHEIRRTMAVIERRLALQRKRPVGGQTFSA